MKLALGLVILALAVPFVGAAPLPTHCGSDCTIEAAATGYNPPVVTIATGSSVTWVSADIFHVTRDVGVGSGSSACFEAAGEGMGGAAPPVRFDLVGASLVATIDGVSTPCPTAVATPAGAVLSYYCTIHPTMRGALVVTAV